MASNMFRKTIDMLRRRDDAEAFFDTKHGVSRNPPPIDYDKIWIVNKCGYALKKYTPVAIGDLVDETVPESATAPAPGYEFRTFEGNVIDRTNFHRTAVMLEPVDVDSRGLALVKGVVPGIIRTGAKYIDSWLRPFTNNTGGYWEADDAHPIMRFPGAGRFMSRYADATNGYHRGFVDINSSGHEWEFQGTPNFDLSAQASITLSGTKKSIYPENAWNVVTNPVVSTVTSPISGDSGTVWSLVADYAYAEIFGTVVWEADDGDGLSLYATHANSGGTILDEAQISTHLMPGDTSDSDGGKIAIPFRSFVPSDTSVWQNGEVIAIRAVGAGTITFQSQWLRVWGVGYTRGAFVPSGGGSGGGGGSSAVLSYVNQQTQGMA